MSNQMMKIGYCTAFGMANVCSALSFIKRLLFTEASTECIRTKPRGLDALPHTKAYWVSLQRERIADLKAKLEAGQLTSAFLKDTIADLKDLMGAKLGSPAVLFYELAILVQGTVDTEQAAIIQDAQADIVASLYYAPTITYANFLADIQLLIETTDLNTIISGLGQQWLGFYRTVFSPEDYDKALARISNYAEVQLSMQQTLSQEQIGLAQGQIEAFNQWRHDQLAMPKQTVDPRVLVSCYQPQVKIDGECQPENAGRLKSTLFKRALSAATFPLRYLSSHPIMSGGMMFALKAAAAYAQQAPTKLDTSDITRAFSSDSPNFEVRDIKPDLISNDVTEVLQRRLQSEVDTCKGSIHFSEPDAAWTVALGGASTDSARKVVVDDEGNVVVVGQTSSFGLGTDILLMHFDAFGRMNWAKTLGGADSDFGNDLLAKPNGEVVVTGVISSIGAGNRDVLLAEFARNGNLAWARAIGGTGNDLGVGVGLKNNGSVLITGYTDSYGAGSNDVLLAQVDSIGSLEWARVLGGTDSDIGRDLVISDNGGFILTGGTASYGHGGMDLFIIKFNSNNQLIWAKVFGGLGDELGLAISPIDHESLIMAGYISSVGAGDRDCLLVKIDVNGTLLWSKAVGGTNQDLGVDIGVKPNGKIIVVGFTASFGGGLYSALLAEYNTAGDLEWAQSIGDIASTKGYGVAIKNDSSIVWVGDSRVFSGSEAALIMHSTPTGHFRQYESGTTLANIVPIVTDINPTNASSVGFEDCAPVIEQIQLNVSSVVNGLEVGDIDRSALIYQPIMPNTTAWPTPADAYLNYRWQYIVPEHKFKVLEAQPQVQIKAENADWISYDEATRTLSGTPVFASQGEVQVRLIFETLLVPNLGLFTPNDITLALCLRVDHSTFIKRLGGIGVDSNREIAVKVDGSTVISGYSNSFGSSGEGDLLLIQLSPNGDLDWARSYGGGGGFYNPSGLVTKPDGSVVVSAQSSYFGITNGSGMAIVLAQFEADGRLDWSSSVTGGTNDFGFGLSLKPDGAVIFHGQAMFRGRLLMQFDSNGNLDWIKTQVIDSDYTINQICVGHDGAIYGVGQIATNGVDMLLMKFTSEGDFSWAKAIGGSGYDSGNSISISAENSIILAGSTSSFGQSSGLLVKCNSHGDILWANNIRGSVVHANNDKLLVMDGDFPSISLSLVDTGGIPLWKTTIDFKAQVVSIAQHAIKPDGSVLLYGSTQDFGARDSDLILVSVDSSGYATFPGSVRLVESNDARIDYEFVSPTVSDVNTLVLDLNYTYLFSNFTPPTLVSLGGTVIEDVWFLDYLTVPTILNHPFAQSLSLDLNSLLGRDVVVTRIAQANDAFLPRWLSYDATSRVLAGVPAGNVRGNYFIDMELEGYGHSQTVTLAINVTNTVPYLNEWPVYNTTIGRFVVQLPYVDDEGDVIRPYGIDQADGQLAPTIGSIDANTGRLFGTTLSGDQGVYVFNITASDPYNQGWQLVTVNVLNADPIVQFGFTDPPPVTVGSLFSYAFPETAFVDRDGDLLSYQVQVPSFVSFNANSRTLAGTPLANDRGEYVIVFTATDGYGGQASAAINLSVNGVPLQQMTFASITTSQVGQYFSQMLPSGLFVDPDGDVVTYQLFEDIQHIKPTWLDFNPLTNTLSGTPNANSHQAIPVRFQVTDGRGGEVFYDLSIVTPNAAPMVGQSLDTQSISVDQTRSLLISSTVLSDPDGDELFYFLELVSGEVQSWVSLTGNVISLSPKSGHQGVYQFRVIGSDPQGQEASTTLTVTVLNRSPRLVYDIPDPAVAHAGQAWAFSLDADNFVDDDNDPLDYDATLSSGAPLPQWITFNPIRRSFTGVPTGLDRGETTLKVKVDDRFGGQAHGLFNVSIVNSEAVPRDRLFDQQASVLQGSFTFTIPEFIDPDGDQVSYSSRLRNGDPLPSWIHFDPASRTYTVLSNQAPPGNYRISAISTDEYGKVNEESFNLAIQAAPSLDEDTSTAKVLQRVLPLIAVVGLLTVVVSTLGWRTRRIAKTDRRIRAWASVEHKRQSAPSDVINYEALYLHLSEIAVQLDKDQSMELIERSLMAFSTLVARYYAQQGMSLAPMTQLLGLGTVNTLFKYVHSNVLELTDNHTLTEDTLDAARLLHFFLGIVLREHTGRYLRLSYEVKVKYFRALDALIARLPTKTRADIHILHELRSCREAVVCMTDTNTLSVLCKNSLSHLLSPGGLVADLKALVFDIPSTWYVGLLVMNQRLSSAKQAITQLTELQNYAARETDWEFRYGMINILLNVITTTRNKAMLTQAIEGQQRYGQPTLLGYKHLLNDKQSCLLRWRNHWVRRQAKWSLSQVADRLSQDAKRLLSGYCQQVPTGRKQRRVSVLVTPLDSQQLQAGATDWSQAPTQLAERTERALEMLNPMYRGTTLPGKRPPIQPRQVRPSG